jgi:hypothetical protein
MCPCRVQVEVKESGRASLKFDDVPSGRERVPLRPWLALWGATSAERDVDFTSWSYRGGYWEDASAKVCSFCKVYDSNTYALNQV